MLLGFTLFDFATWRSTRSFICTHPEIFRVCKPAIWRSIYLTKLIGPRMRWLLFCIRSSRSFYTIKHRLCRPQVGQNYTQQQTKFTKASLTQHNTHTVLPTRKPRNLLAFNCRTRDPLSCLELTIRLNAGI